MIKVKCKVCHRVFTRFYGALSPVAEALRFPCVDCGGEVEEVKEKLRGVPTNYRDGMLQYPIPVGVEIQFSFGASANIGIRREGNHLLVASTHAVQIAPQAPNCFKVAMGE